MGYKQNKNVPAMERELNYFLYDICVHWGFCIPPKHGERISKKSNYTAHEFAIDLLKAEGMNPDFESTWMNKLTEKFKERFGENEINSEGFVDRTHEVN